MSEGSVSEPRSPSSAAGAQPHPEPAASGGLHMRPKGSDTIQRASLVGVSTQQQVLGHL